MMTRCMEVGAADNWAVRWVMNVVKGDIDGSGSEKSRVWRVDVGKNFICADEGKMRRLLRSKSWQKIA